MSTYTRWIYEIVNEAHSAELAINKLISNKCKWSRNFFYLRWLEIVSWRMHPGPQNTATESRPMHTTIELKMEYVAHAHVSVPGLHMCE